MNDDVRIAVILGGPSEEREVSLATGKAVAEALRQNFEVDLFDIQNEALPPGLDPERHIVFSALHGRFGEDGGIQSQLEAAGIAYAGTGPEGSRLCFAKEETKAKVEAVGVRVAPGLSFQVPGSLPGSEQISRLGSSFVLKPDRQGSSIDLFMIDGLENLSTVLDDLKPGHWLLEKRIRGRELTVGMLRGKSLGLVEIRPHDGIYDYCHKYTKGLTEYIFPARVEPAVESEIRRAAELAYAVCGCRDFARIDFMLNDKEESYFLEINTMPGLTATSLLPMSASCAGYDFPQLALELVMPARQRILSTTATVES